MRYHPICLAHCRLASEHTKLVRELAEQYAQSVSLSYQWTRKIARH